MKNNKHLIKQCQGFILASVVAMGIGFPAETVWAIGPGEGMNSPTGTTSSGGPGILGPGGSGSGTIQQPVIPENTDQTGGTSSSGAISNAWKRSGEIYLMLDGSPITNVFRRGIDVSRWQGEINWSQVAADDVSFVMLGTRSKGDVDPYFHQNIQGASNVGIEVGVYIYSLATSPEMAAAEADFVLNLIKDYPVSYPVAFDMEDDVQAALSKEELAAIANEFCGRISAAGYYPIIYANEYWLNNRLDMSQMNYPVWVARYHKKPDYSSPVMWQATSSGSINGINGNVDIDFQFKDFSQIIPGNLWRTIGGKTYYYANYRIQKNNWIYDGDGWYYLDVDGQALKNWQTLGGERYYLDEESGKMQYGWKAENEVLYYLGKTGAVSKGWIQDEGNWYFGDRTTGAIQTGWLVDNGQTYYLNDSGAMATGWIMPDGKWRYMNGNGVLATGWIQDNGVWYYSDKDGIMQTGWLNDGGYRYYLRSNGARASGWRQMEDIWYYFDLEGRMVTGWQFINDAWYYFDSNGHMATGLIELGGIRYYLSPENGSMARDSMLTIGDVTYYADASGSLTVIEPQENQGEQLPGNPGAGNEIPGDAGTGTEAPGTTGAGTEAPGTTGTGTETPGTTGTGTEAPGTTEAETQAPTGSVIGTEPPTGQGTKEQAGGNMPSSSETAKTGIHGGPGV